MLVTADHVPQANRVFGEYTRMLQMRHELLVKGHSIFIEELDLGRRQVNMVMEYCEGGDLAGYLARQMRSGTPPSEDDVTGKLTMVRTPLESTHDAL